MTTYERERESGDLSTTDRILRGASLAALLVIAFTAGSIVTTADLFPGTQIGRAYQGGMALYQQATAYKDVFNSDLWYPERSTERGVTVNEAALTEPGPTLYTSGEAGSAYLIDAEGNILHEWHKLFSEWWTADSGIERPQPDSHVHFRKAVMYPNGDLLAVVEGTGDTPYGYGIVKLDRESNVIWTYFGRAHHDIDVGPDGRIYALVHHVVDEPDEYFTNLATPRLLDALVVLSPEGEELHWIPLLDAVVDSRYRQLIHTVSAYAVADPLHANNVDFITEEMARNFPFAKPGQILLSFRELNAIGVLDLDARKMVWAARGPWLGQHDPDIMADGSILLFDNYGDFITDYRQTSRIIQFDPRSFEIIWEYGGTPGHPFGSLIRGSQQRLKNGNTLIVESSGGRIVEVTPDGKIAWEFVNPVRDGPPDQEPRIPMIGDAQRVDPALIDARFLSPDQLSQASQ